MALGAVLCACGDDAPAPIRLTILHHSDGESHLRGGGGKPGIARFVPLLRRVRAEEHEARREVVFLCAGDTFLPSADKLAERRLLTFDAEAMRVLRHDAVALGNHDFDLGPAFLARFVEAVQDVPFVSANVDVSREPALRTLAQRGRLPRSTLVRKGKLTVGVIGLTTPELLTISSPGDVSVRGDLAACVQEEVARLRAAGATLVVVLSHLQGLAHDRALVASLRGVDVVVAGGGEELLADEAHRLAEADVGTAVGSYPLRVRDADGREVLLVTVPGAYRYLGRLRLSVRGREVTVDAGSGPLPADGAPDWDLHARFAPDTGKQHPDFSQWVTPEVALDGRREALRAGSTNLGNLVADALLWEARRHPVPEDGARGIVALVNAGGIRAESVLPAFDALTPAQLAKALPYPNKIVRVTVTRAELRDLLEHAAASHRSAKGVFAQIGGMRATLRPDATPRVRDVRLDDGTMLVDAQGAVVAGPPVHVITTDFLVRPRGDTGRGGDGYPFGASPAVTPAGGSPLQAVMDYLRAPRDAGGLGGIITARDAPAQAARWQIGE